MNERNLEELRRRVQRAERDGAYDVQYLLDKLELVLEETPMDTPDELARSLAEQLVEEPDEWDTWITHAEDDYHTERPEWSSAPSHGLVPRGRSVLLSIDVLR